jgi:aryl-alcohol dehydrogenase-like predicted oxidoreductase
VGFIDKAHLYAGGESERAIGAALAPFRDDELLVATKGGYNPGGGRPERLRAELEESFERLRTDTIALYYLHRVHSGVPLEETLSVLGEYRDAGRIRHVGVSEVSVEQIERARAVVPIAAVQNEYNLSQRNYEDVVAFCEAEAIAFVPQVAVRWLRRRRRFSYTWLGLERQGPRWETSCREGAPGSTCSGSRCCARLLRRRRCGDGRRTARQNQLSD